MDRILGIPDKSRIKDIGPYKGITRLIVHKHKADRAGLHYDLRIQEQNMAHSWAIKKQPLPDEAHPLLLGVIQPTHTAQYMNFAGTLHSGYGKGTVEKIIDTPIDVLEASNDKIKFWMPKEGLFALIRTGDKNWLFRRMEDPKRTIDYKPKFPQIKTEAGINLEDSMKILQPKVDGAHSIIQIGDKHNTIYSYRRSKKDNEPIDYSHKLPKIRDMMLPKAYDGTILRAEVFAQKGSKALSPMTTSALLNSSVVNARERMKRDNIELKPMIFDVVRWKGSPVEDIPYEEKIPLMQELSKQSKGLLLSPSHAFSPFQKKKLIDEIKSGEHPLSNEGVIERQIGSNKAKKWKVKEEYDVWVRKITPNYRGFWYSVSPKGPIVGRVGTGFAIYQYEDMWRSPSVYEGRQARLSGLGQYESKAIKAPVFLTWAVENNLE